MKTYNVIQMVEMMVSHKVRANSAEEADDIATDRTMRVAQSLASIRECVTFGDVNPWVTASEDAD